MKRICLLLGVALLAGCGSSDDSVQFEGSLQTTVQRSGVGVRAGVPDVQVCALGECGRTDADGKWSFDIDDDAGFNGGDVLFAIDGGGLNTNVVVTGIDDESEEVDIDFVVFPNGSVGVTAVRQDDFDDNVGGEVEEEADDIDDNADDVSDDIDDEADDVSDNVDDDADDISDDIDDEADDIADEVDDSIDDVF